MVRMKLVMNVTIAMMTIAVVRMNACCSIINIIISY